MDHQTSQVQFRLETDSRCGESSQQDESEHHFSEEEPHLHEDPHLGFQTHDVHSCNFCHGALNSACGKLCRLPKTKCQNPLPHDFATCSFRRLCTFCGNGGHTRDHCTSAPENTQFHICQMCQVHGHSARQCRETICQICQTPGHSALDCANLRDMQELLTMTLTALAEHKAGLAQHNSFGSLASLDDVQEIDDQDMLAPSPSFSDTTQCNSSSSPDPRPNSTSSVKSGSVRRYTHNPYRRNALSGTALSQA